MALSKQRPLKGTNLLAIFDDYVALDCETTGYDPNYNEIIEVAAVKVKHGQEVARYQQLTKPKNPINDFIIELTGITNEMVVDAPTIAAVLPSFFDFVGEFIIVGHNVHFDINFLYESAERAQLSPLQNNFVDTMRLSQWLFKELDNHRLSTLAAHCGVNRMPNHRSLDDALSTMQCYEYIKTYVADKNINFAELKREKKHIKYLNKLKAKDIVANITDIDETNLLYGKVCVFTGVLEKMKRADAMQVVINMGGINNDGVNKQTNYLILGNNDYCSTIIDGKSTKQKKAEALKLAGYDIEIISENVFYDMIEE